MDSIAAHRVGVTFETLLLDTMLHPMAAGLDALGDAGIETLAQSIAQRDSNGFGALIAARLAGDD